MKEAYVATIRKYQIAWLGYRDENCAMKSFEFYVGSQAREAEQNRCLAEMSKFRADQLALKVE